MFRGKCRAPQNQDNSPIGASYGNGLWLVVGFVNTRVDVFKHSELLILTSADGVNWIQRHSVEHTVNDFLADVTYGNGQFVAVGESGMILTS